MSVHPPPKQAVPRRAIGWFRRPAVQRLLRRTALLICLVAVLVAAGVSCTTVIIPPENVGQPAAVYLLDHGRTASLVLPDEQGQMIRFAYGDWRYYALAQRDLCTGAAALLWRTPGTLGRQIMPGPATAEDLVQQVGVGIENLYVLQVERQKVDQLRQALQATWQQQSETSHYNHASRLHFVHHPRKYTLGQSSNRVAADWLEQLGCQVRGPALLSNWRVQGSADPP